jgi:hypothetical protein
MEVFRSRFENDEKTPRKENKDSVPERGKVNSGRG